MLSIFKFVVFLFISSTSLSAANLYQIDRFIEKQSFGKAEKWCTKHQREFNDYSIFHYKCGYVYLSLKNYNIASSYFEKAMQKGLSGSVQLQKASFYSYYLNQKYRKALSVYRLEDLRKLKPDIIEAYLFSLHKTNSIKRLAKAINIVNQRKTNINSPGFAKLVCSYTSSKQKGSCFRKAIKSYPNDKSLRNDYFKFLISIKSFKEAQRVPHQLISSENLSSLIHLKIKLKRLNEAYSLLKKYRKKLKSKQYHYLKIELAGLQKDCKSIQALTKFSKSHPYFFERLIECKINKGKPVDNNTIKKIASKQDPFSLYIKGLVAFNNSDFNQAFNSCSTGLRRDQESCQLISCALASAVRLKNSNYIKSKVSALRNCPAEASVIEQEILKAGLIQDSKSLKALSSENSQRGELITLLNRKNVNEIRDYIDRNNKRLSKADLFLLKIYSSRRASCDGFPQKSLVLREYFNYSFPKRRLMNHYLLCNKADFDDEVAYEIRNAILNSDLPGSSLNLRFEDLKNSRILGDLYFYTLPDSYENWKRLYTLMKTSSLNLDVLSLRNLLTRAYRFGNPKEIREVLSLIKPGDDVEWFRYSLYIGNLVEASKIYPKLKNIQSKSRLNEIRLLKMLYGYMSGDFVGLKKNLNLVQVKELSLSQKQLFIQLSEQADKR